MKRNMQVAGVVCALCLAAALAAPAQAQEWSAAQKEVWQNVENYWALDAKGDLEGFMSYFHPDYIGWSYDSATPSNRETVRKFIAQEYQTSKTLVYDITPLAISIHGNVAFVDYYYNQLVKNSEGKTEGVRGRWTDILMKQGDRWLLIGDHGGRNKKD